MVQPTRKSHRLLAIAKVLHVAAILVGLASLAAFIIGVLDVRKSVGKIGMHRDAHLSIEQLSPRTTPFLGDVGGLSEPTQDKRKFSAETLPRFSFAS